jgi:chitinase
MRPTTATLAVIAAVALLACTGTASDPPTRAAAAGGGDGGAPGPTVPDGGAGPVDPGGGPEGGGGPVDGGALPADRRIVGYFTAWSVYGRNFHVADIPADRLTHVNYAFANVSAQGECSLGDPYADIDKFYAGDSWEAGALRGSFNQLARLKQAHPHLRTLISVGGWTWSGRFSDVALDPAARTRFAASCAAFIDRYGFDGVDIDWEYPVGGGLAGNTSRPEDKHNYTLLLQELRAQLDALAARTGRAYLLTIAAPAGPGIMANLEIAALGAVLDWINVMSYDFHGSWSPLTNFNAPLYPSAADPSSDPDIRQRFNADAAIRGYLAAGAPRGKLVLGVPFYGRGWAGVPDVGHGLYQAHTGVPTGTWEAGVFDYADLARNYVPTYQRYVHPEAGVPWLYSPQAGVMISYDDPESLGRKVDYVVANGLGGAMFWELSGDSDDWALLGALGALRQ